jgi:hypothetical protein
VAVGVTHSGTARSQASYLREIGSLSSIALSCISRSGTLRFVEYPDPPSSTHSCIYYCEVHPTFAMAPYQSWQPDTMPPTTTSTTIWPSNTSNMFDRSATESKTDISGPTLAGIAIVIGLCALLVAILQLRAEYQRRRHAREIENELIELEAEFSEV